MFVFLTDGQNFILSVQKLSLKTTDGVHFDEHYSIHTNDTPGYKKSFTLENLIQLPWCFYTYLCLDGQCQYQVVALVGMF